MADILKTSDFSTPGRYQINLSGPGETDLEERIVTVQKKILDKMLGCGLANLLVADLDANGVPTEQRFLDIFNAFCETVNLNFVSGFCPWIFITPHKVTFNGNIQVESEGIKVMLKGFTFFDMVKDMPFKRTSQGPKKNVAENSSDARFSEIGMSKFYNDALDSYNAIQTFIVDDLTTYPEFDGSQKAFNSFI